MKNSYHICEISQTSWKGIPPTNFSEMTQYNILPKLPKHKINLLRFAGISTGSSLQWSCLYGAGLYAGAILCNSELIGVREETDAAVWLICKFKGRDYLLNKEKQQGMVQNAGASNMGETGLPYTWRNNRREGFPEVSGGWEHKFVYTSEYSHSQYHCNLLDGKWKWRDDLLKFS